MRKWMIGAVAIGAVATSLTASTALAVTPVDGGSAGGTTITVNNGPGDQTPTASRSSFALPTAAGAAATKARHGARAVLGLKPMHSQRAAIGNCTMAVPPTRATVEAEIANASDFCELVAHALAGEVFRVPVIITPGQLWHYADAVLSCRLRYGHTRYRLTIHNSEPACRWLRRLAPGWRLEAATNG